MRKLWASSRCPRPQGGKMTIPHFLDTFPANRKLFPVTSGTRSLTSPNPSISPPLLWIFSRSSALTHPTFTSEDLTFLYHFPNWGYFFPALSHMVPVPIFPGFGFIVPSRPFLPSCLCEKKIPFPWGLATVLASTLRTDQETPHTIIKRWSC